MDKDKLNKDMNKMFQNKKFVNCLIVLLVIIFLWLAVSNFLGNDSNVSDKNNAPKGAQEVSTNDGGMTSKELLSYEGQSISATGSPKMILKTAYTIFDFIDEDIWLGMLKSRNDLTHIYDESSARRLVGVILKDYIPAFVKMQKGIEEYYGIELENI